jgi:hypothetical protein
VWVVCCDGVEAGEELVVDEVVSMGVVWVWSGCYLCSRVSSRGSPRSVFGKFDRGFVILRFVWLVLVFFRPTICIQVCVRAFLCYNVPDIGFTSQYLTFPGLCELPAGKLGPRTQSGKPLLAVAVLNVADFCMQRSYHTSTTPLMLINLGIL